VPWVRFPLITQKAFLKNLEKQKIGRTFTT